MKAQKIKAIIVEPYHNRKIAEKVAESTGAKVVDFAQFPGALPNTDTYVQLIDALVNRLGAALKLKRPFAAASARASRAHFDAPPK